MTDNFSLIRGSPSHRLLQRLGLGTFTRRAAALVLVAWTPLFVVWIIARYVPLAPARVLDTFMVELTLRFLVALFLLLLAEFTVELRTTQFVRYLVDSEVIAPEHRERFSDLIDELASAVRSPASEAVILAVAYLLALAAGPLPLLTAATGARLDVGLARPTAEFAWWWHKLVSLPIYDFLLLAWFWRLGLWTWFLRRLTRIPPRLDAAHPDRAGGLGFVSVCQTSFWPVVLGAGIATSGTIWRAMVFGAATVAEYRALMIAYAIVASALFVLPPFVLVPLLLRTRIAGLLSYGKLANHYTRRFRNRWMREEAAPDDDLVGTSDIQSLADLITSYDGASRMRLVPLDGRTVGSLAAAAGLPLLPLVLTLLPAKEVFQHLLRLLI